MSEKGRPGGKRWDGKRQAKIRKLLGKRTSLEENRALGRFVARYVDCEATARALVGYYLADRGVKTSEKRRLHVHEIFRAAEYFGVEADGELVDLVDSVFYGGDGIRGKKTPRQLRNALIHRKTLADVEEIEEREGELLERMDRWLEAVGVLGSGSGR